MNRLIRLSWKVLTVMTCVGSVTLAQTQSNSATGGRTTGGSTTGANSTARTNGVLAGPQLGGSSSTVTGLGAGSRIDRTSTTNADNPRAARGSNVLSGDAGQQGQGGGRSGQTAGSSFSGGAGGGRGGAGNQTNQRRQTANRAQYSTRTIDFPSFATQATDGPGLSTSPVVVLQETLTSLPQSSIHVSLDDDGVVVLRGKVTTESNRRVAERMAKLEPGVSRVRNELEISPDATEL